MTQYKTGTMTYHRTTAATWLFASILATGAVFWSGVQAQGRPLPPEVEKLFKGFDKVSVTEEPGRVVHLVMKRPVATYDMARSAYSLMCTSVYGNEKKAWGGRDFTRLEVRNSIKAQGYSFPASKADCLRMGPMNSEQKSAHEKSVAWVCVAGNPCRERRPGEKTSGDE